MAATTRPFKQTDNTSDADAFSRPARERFLIRLDASCTEGDPDAGSIAGWSDSFRDLSSLCFWKVVERVVLEFEGQQTNDFNRLAIQLGCPVDHLVDG